VDRDRMRVNLDAAGGAVFSHAALLALIRSGMERDDAYRVVQTAAADAMASGGDLAGVLGDRVPDATFSLDRYLSGASASVDHLARVTVEWLREPRAGW